MRNANWSRSTALLLLRSAVGLIFMFHGYPKLANSSEWTQGFVQMGFPAYFAYIAGTLETFGGAFLILGLLSQVCGLLLAIEMCVALLRVDLPSGPITKITGYELSLILAAASFTIAAFGAGEFSLSKVISLLRSRMASNRTQREPREPEHA